MYFNNIVNVHSYTLGVTISNILLTVKINKDFIFDYYNIILYWYLHIYIYTYQKSKQDPNKYC